MSCVKAVCTDADGNKVSADIARLQSNAGTVYCQGNLFFNNLVTKFCSIKHIFGVTHFLEFATCLIPDCFEFIHKYDNITIGVINKVYRSTEMCIWRTAWTCISIWEQTKKL